MEHWTEISEFQDYSVSDQGRVRNDNTYRILRQRLNQQGITFVSLYKGGREYSRSVALLVAREYILPYQNPLFNAPIHLNNDRSDNSVENLMLRPRWFAVQYRQQFCNGYYRRLRIGPVKNLKTGDIFDDLWDAVKTFGLLYGNTRTSIQENTAVWPGGHRFVMFDPVIV